MDRQPRLLLLDTRSELFSSKRAASVESMEDTWHGKTTMVAQDTHSRSSTTEPLKTYWSDLNDCPLHSKSVLEIPQVPAKENEKEMGFYAHGSEILSKHSDFMDSLMEDRLRYLLEECDAFQGFQLLCDASTGFGALAAGLTQEINDFLPKSVVQIYGISSNDPLSKRNEAQTIAALNDLKMMYIPMHSPYEDTVHASAYLSTAIDSLSLLLTDTQQSISLADMSTSVSRGLTLSSLAMASPVQLQDFKRYVPGTKLPWLYDLSLSQSYLSVEKHHSSFSVLRGHPHLKSPSTLGDFHAFLSSFRVPFGGERSLWSDQGLSSVMSEESSAFVKLSASHSLVQVVQQWQSALAKESREEAKEILQNLYETYDDLSY